MHLARRDDEAAKHASNKTYGLTICLESSSADTLGVEVATLHADRFMRVGGAAVWHCASSLKAAADEL